MAPLLQVEDLSVVFTRRGQKPFAAVDKVSFSVDAGQTVGLVGESGSGKSVTSLGIMRLVPGRRTETSGSVRFEGTDLMTLSGRQMRDRRGRDLAMIFQDPLSSLNPVVSIGIQVAEVLERHRGLKRSAAMREAADLLDSVGIPDPNRRIREYPHQLSGGMRQRALIAMALACRPRLLIADEPTTALDVTIQAQILTLLRDLVKDHGTALIMITHDLGVVAGLCDEVNVMYGGRIVERAQRHDLFAEPAHPYTHGLLRSIPRLDALEQRLTPIRGSVSDNIPWETGCAFAPRCDRSVAACTERAPLLVTDPDRPRGHLVRCHNHVPVGAPVFADVAVLDDAALDPGGLDHAGPVGAPGSVVPVDVKREQA